MEPQHRHKYRTRSQTALNHNNFIVHHIPPKRLRFSDYTVIIPDEILTLIFSYLNHEELYKNVRCVCKRWYFLVSTPMLWRNISAGKSVPTEVLCKWIEHSPLLKEISLFGRNDIDIVTEKISRYSPRIQSIVIKDCWGTSKSNIVQGTPLCKMVKRCGQLRRFNFSQTRIRSTKFFKMLGQKRGKDRLSKCTYYGPISKKQIEALVKSLLQNQDYYVSSLYTGKKKKLITDSMLGENAKASLVAKYLWDNIMYANPNISLGEIEFSAELE